MIRHPNVIIGNSKMLVTMGERGELFSLFYPGRDQEQHLSGSKGYLYFDGNLLSQDSKHWSRKQMYLENTNIVNTILDHTSGLGISIHDFVHPDKDVLIRNYEISAKNGIEGKFFYYSDFQVGGKQNQNSAFCDTDAGLLIQYNRQFHVGVASKPDFEEWQVGKISAKGWVEAAESDMTDGKLQGNLEEIGNLDNAIGWNLDLKAGERVNYTILIGVSQDKSGLYNAMSDLLETHPDVLMDETAKYWKDWISESRILKLPVLSGNPTLQRQIFAIYNRSLLCLTLLGDPASGALIAAPEFDPDFEMCGGYGFCWNRDSAEVAQSLLNASYPQYCGNFIEWCKKTQMKDGSWFQRYWLDGKAAPSWGNFDDSTQIDETGSTLQAFEKYYSSLEGANKTEFLQDSWKTVSNAAGYLFNRSSKGVHDTCRCLWESEKGIFCYTNAAVYAGLIIGSHFAEDYGEKELAEKWLERAALIKKNTLEQMWLEDGYFAKGIVEGSVDSRVDASILGAFIPFRMLSPQEPQEKAMILSMIRNIETKLKVPVNGYSGIRRYEYDNYVGGNPWIVTTLWLSAALLNLAKYSENKHERDVMVNKAVEYIMWSVKGATDTGLLPEQVDGESGRPAWAIPLSWSCALMVNNAILLDELE
ncbi:oligosaccharide amylase [Methanohalophilus levihalophilus]|uniref:glycoside hydrolase family 15 protein n=1 Tax=Methanohalophilus levihalophilus TaxID=1431282 RepID=UPI001AE367A7|nr:glycoside hydrolase family 15 protein [Methanohalophilus levihalophilus]MBP2030684.1 oligosaccharide amylase [Methanohalophilus levihalophilus]